MKPAIEPYHDLGYPDLAINILMLTHCAKRNITDNHSSAADLVRLDFIKKHNASNTFFFM